MDQRRSPRIAAQLPVIDCHRDLPARTRDISREGMFVCLVPREIGTRFVLEVTFPTVEVPLRVAAEVVRLEPEGMGVRLIHAAEPQRLYFSALVDRIAGRSP